MKLPPPTSGVPSKTCWMGPIGTAGGVFGAWSGRTNTSTTPFVSPGTRPAAPDSNATSAPSPESEPGGVNGVIAVGPSCAPDAVTLTLVVVPATRSRANQSPPPLVSLLTRLAALDQNRTWLPSADIAPSPVDIRGPLGSWP